MKFALVDGGALMPMQELDGILNGDDVASLFLVNLIYKGREGGRFAAAGGTGNEHHAGAQICSLAELLGQVESLEIRNGVGNHAHNNRAASALGEDVHAKASQLRNAIGNIARAFLLQLVDRVRISSDQVGRDPSGCPAALRSPTPGILN